MKSAGRRRGPLPGLAALALAYLLSQFFRTALGVVAPEIAADLGLPPARLGLLSAAWFLAFAAAQIPVGVALDRAGPRRTVGLLFAVAALGCLVMAAAGGLAAAVLGQVLLGLGCAPVYMGALVVLARWYPPARFATLASLFLALGNAGTLLGTTPLAWAAAALGWRGAFAGLAALVLLAAGLVLLLVRDAPPGATSGISGQGGLAETLRGVGRVAGNRRLWPILPLAFAGYAVVVTLRGLWGGPYLAAVFGLDPPARGNVLLLVSLGIVGGTLLYAAVERRLDRRREPALAGAGLAVLALLALAAAPAAPLPVVAGLLTLQAAAGVSYALLMAQGRRFLPDAEVGRGLTLLNAACFLGAAVLQGLSGLVVAAAGAAGLDPVGTYRCLFAFLAGYLALAGVLYWPSKDRRLAAPASTGDG